MATKKTNIDLPKAKDISGQGSGTDADVTPQERKVLEDIDYRKAESEDQPLIEGQLDNTDGDGDPLNEDDADLSGEDLDVPGAEDDDLDEEVGEEDEENNEYSLDDNDDEDNDL